MEKKKRRNILKLPKRDDEERVKMVDDNVIDLMYADEEQREDDERLRKKLGDKEFEKQRYGIV